MIKVSKLLLIISSIAATAYGAETCPKGEKRLHPAEECIPVQLFNYLYCLEKSGGGKVEVIQRGNADSSKNLEIRLKGKGSGVVVKGEGGVGYTTSNSARIAREIHEKLDPTLAAKCEKFANINAKPPVSKPKQKEKRKKIQKPQFKVSEKHENKNEALKDDPSVSSEGKNAAPQSTNSLKPIDKNLEHISIQNTAQESVIYVEKKKLEKWPNNAAPCSTEGWAGLDSYNNIQTFNIKNWSKKNKYIFEGVFSWDVAQRSTKGQILFKNLKAGTKNVIAVWEQPKPRDIFKVDLTKYIVDNGDYQIEWDYLEGRSCLCIISTDITVEN